MASTQGLSNMSAYVSLAELDPRDAVAQQC